MDIIKELVGKLTSIDKHNIYLRELALEMEELDLLEGRVRVKKNLIKNYEKVLRKIIKENK